MSESINYNKDALPAKRYQLAAVADHLASNYVMGLLSARVTQRLESLRRDYRYDAIDKRISYWENKMSPLNDATPELEPLPDTFAAIQTRLNINPAPAKKEKGRFSWFMAPWTTGLGLAFCMMLAVVLIRTPAAPDPLSYVAVLQDAQQSPQVVAATYGNSKNLVLDIIELPDIDSSESFELWVTSKTDNQARSLGPIPTDVASFQRQLSDAEWRLIVDSADLIISIEEEGGSAIGEPSEMIVSRGLCIRLSAWEQES